MPLTPQDIMYITISIVVAVTGTLLSVALYKVVQILGVFQEITGYYYTVKQTFQVYENIPKIVLERISTLFTQTKTSTSKKKSS